MHIIKNKTRNVIFLSLLLFLSCKSNSVLINNGSNGLQDNYFVIQKLKIWTEIDRYIQKYKTKSCVFQLQFINDSNNVRAQINYLLKQNTVFKRPPLFYTKIDSSLIVVYTGMEEFMDSKALMDKLIKEPLFMGLKMDSDSDFLLYHPAVWEYIIDGQTIITDTLAKPFNYIRLNRFKAPPIEEDK